MAATTFTLDFNNLTAGTTVDNQYSADGVTITGTALNSSGNPISGNRAMIFDSDNPTGGDLDLATSNLQEVLILSEDGDASDPDDNLHGGSFTFDFAKETTVSTLTFLDIEDDAIVDFYDENGTLIQSVTVPEVGDNNQAISTFNVSGVYQMVVNLEGSGAVDNLVYSQNLPPVAGDDTYNVSADDPSGDVDGNVLTNDSHPEGDTIRITSITNGTDTDSISDPHGSTGQPMSVPGDNGGIIQINNGGNVYFDPNGEFDDLAVGETASTSVTYTLVDPDGEQTTATVTFVVTGVNDDPVANDDTATTPYGEMVTVDVLDNDTDIDGDTLTVTNPTVDPAEGTVQVVGNEVKFTPAPGFEGDATITYTVDDGNGGTDQGTLVVTVEDAPRDGIVDGTDGDDIIDGSYFGDPDGDQIDAGDELVAGEGPDDDIVFGYGGNDDITSGAGDDEIYGGEGNDTVCAGDGDDIIYGDQNGGAWQYEYYDLDPNGSPNTLAEAGFTQNGGLDHEDTPTEVGYANTIAPADYDTQDDYALKFTSTIEITTGGVYTFSTTSDDGSKLFINGVEVVDNDGHHGFLYKDGTINLPAGEHVIEIIYYENNGGNGMTATVSGPDTGGSPTDLETYSGLIIPEGDDYLKGGDGEDTIYGEGGNDTIIGGDDADDMYGGDDEDTFLINGPGDGIGDTISGGDGGVDNDTLDLTGSVSPGGSLTVTTTTDSDGNGFDGTVEYYDEFGVLEGTTTFTNIENIVPCFTPGTAIKTITGEVAVESLRVGDRVFTRDNGFQRVRWVGRRAVSKQELSKRPEFNPIEISAGALGNSLPEHTMRVSPQHRMLVEGSRAEMYFGTEEVLVAAAHLTCLPGVSRVEPDEVTYVHVMFDHHEIIIADGAWTESFQPGDHSLAGLDTEVRKELLELFPELAMGDCSTVYPAARMTVRAREAELLFI